MTKQHFEAIADVLRKHGASAMMIADLAVTFKQFNPRFDTKKFTTRAVRREVQPTGLPGSRSS